MNGKARDMSCGGGTAVKGRGGSCARACLEACASSHRCTAWGTRGVRSLAVARCNAEGQWTLLGVLTFLDPPRPDTKITIERAMGFGVDVKMITGALVHSSCARYNGHISAETPQHRTDCNSETMQKCTLCKASSSATYALFACR